MTSDSSLWLRLNVEQLQTFLVVSEELSFRRAADRLHMASSPVSRRIKDLEAAVGAKLFERDTRHVLLTEAGTALLPLARDVVQRFEALRWSVSEGVPPVPPSVKVGLASGAHPSECRLLMDLVQRSFPASEVVPEVGTSVTLLAMLRSEQLVCSLVHLPVSDRDVAVAPVREDELGVAISANHPLASGRHVSVRDLASVPLVVLRQRPEPEAAGANRAALEMAGVRRTIYIDSDWASDVANYVASTNSFAVTPLSEQSPLRRPFEDPRIVLRPLEGLRLTLRTGVAWLRGRPDVEATLRAAVAALRSGGGVDSSPSRPGDREPVAGIVPADPGGDPTRVGAPILR